MAKPRRVKVLTRVQRWTPSLLKVVDSLRAERNLSRDRWVESKLKKDADVNRRASELGLELESLPTVGSYDRSAMKGKKRKKAKK